MLSKEEKGRYQKQIILPEIGVDGQEKLRAAKVLVIGAGGLGCPTLQYLTAAGIGCIGIVDGDTVSLSNLQRQVLYTANDLGKPKTKIAVNRLKSLNTNTIFKTHTTFINAENALAILTDYDIIVDGSDNFSTRYLVNDACVILNKPLVSGAIFKFEGQVSVFNYQGGPTYRCIFPEPPGEGESPNCSDIGVVATLPGIIGTIQANEVIKIATGIGETLSGKLLIMNTLTMETLFYKFKLNEANKHITTLQQTEQYCKPSAPVSIKNVSYDELKQLLNSNNLQLVDVREVEEHEIENIGGINIPLSQFEAMYSSLDSTKTIALYCASGVRSNRFANLLLEKGFKDIFNLDGGVSQLLS